MESNPKRFFHWIQKNFNLANVLTGQDSKKIQDRTKLNFRGQQKGSNLPCMLLLLPVADFWFGVG